MSWYAKVGLRKPALVPALEHLYPTEAAYLRHRYGSVRRAARIYDDMQ